MSFFGLYFNTIPKLNLQQQNIVFLENWFVINRILEKVLCMFHMHHLYNYYVRFE